MSLQDEIANHLSKQMAASIDFSLLSDALVACGWHRVDLVRFLNRHQSVDILLWCEEHCKGTWKNNGSHFIFEDIGDAVNFALIWK